MKQDGGMRVVMLVSNADVAQLIEQLTCNERVGGLNPSIGSMGHGVIGNTADFDSAILGSSPGAPTKQQRRV